MLYLPPTVNVSRPRPSILQLYDYYDGNQINGTNCCTVLGVEFISKLVSRAESRVCVSLPFLFPNARVKERSWAWHNFKGQLQQLTRVEREPPSCRVLQLKRLFAFSIVFIKRNGIMMHLRLNNSTKLGCHSFAMLIKWNVPCAFRARL